MRTIHKYEVETAFKLDLPDTHIILDVQLQRGKPVMWVELNEEHPKRPVKFKLVPTGGMMDDAWTGSYVATFQSNSLVYHLYKIG